MNGKPLTKIFVGRGVDVRLVHAHATHLGLNYEIALNQLHADVAVVGSIEDAMQMAWDLRGKTIVAKEDYVFGDEQLYRDIGCCLCTRKALARALALVTGTEFREAPEGLIESRSDTTAKA